MTEKTIQALVADLEVLRDVYGHASREAMAARRAETEALNRLNEATREFNKAVDKLRQSMPYESDMRRHTLPAIPVTA